jgi:electron transfer flavoprotein alpha/beta subunit
LDIQEYFVIFGKNAAPQTAGQLPQNLQTLGLQEVANAATIEDIISNA